MWRRVTLETPEEADVEEPVTLDEAKQHVIETVYDGNDDYIFRLIAVARDEVEKHTHRALIPRTATMVMSEFPNWSIELPFGKAQSVTSIQYYDTAGTLQTLSGSASPAVFQTDLANAVTPVLTPLRNSVWPTADSLSINPVTVTWEAGYANSASVPPVIKQAILGQIAKWYELRWDGDIIETIEPHFYRLLAPYVVTHFV